MWRPDLPQPPSQPPVESITHGALVLALIVSGRFREPGIHFFTPPDFSQQLGYMEHPAGKLIEPHLHNPVPREVQYTQEVLFIRKGKVRVDFYDHHQCYLRSRVLEAGDVILLIEGGHGFEVLEDVEMIEVKQGPYAGDQDKTRFKGISRADVRLAPEMPCSGE
jgi:mannose-6-phosphate isomerase-like protein (cupin superfamily)